MEPEAQDLSWDVHLEEPSKFWCTAIQSQTLLPILAPKPEPSFVEGWLDRNIDWGGRDIALALHSCLHYSCELCSHWSSGQGEFLS